MDVRLQKKALVSLSELKSNLRLPASFELYDADLTMKLQAAVSHAGTFIGRDLDQVPVISYPFAGSMKLELDLALQVTAVKVGDTQLEASDWVYSDGTMTITGDHPESDVVEVSTEYVPDIKIAVLMHASSMWLNPADSVENLPKASTNLLSQYRQYGRRS